MSIRDARLPQSVFQSSTHPTARDYMASRRGSQGSGSGVVARVDGGISSS